MKQRTFDRNNCKPITMYRTILALLLCASLLTSCKKDNPLTIALYNQYDSATNFNWCEDSIACWGDSFTEGPGSWSYPSHIAFDLGWSRILPGYVQENYNQRVFQGGISGQNSAQISARFFADLTHRSWNHIIWIGRNDSWGDTAIIAERIELMVRALPHQRFIILGILLGDTEGEWLGTPHHTYITEFNARLAAKYGRHFIDPKIGLMARASNTPEDSICLDHDITPAHLRLDFLHLSDAGYHHLAQDILKVVAPCYKID